MYDDLKIILYPDPRLKRVSEPIKIFDAGLAGLAVRMFDLMREAKGVGLAAPQVGVNIRLFITNPTGKPEDDRIYANPELYDAEGEEAAEEGCLSLPGINAEIIRSKNVRIVAQDINGKKFQQTESGYLPRIWQHEFDHLNGTLLTDRMGPTARMECRKTLKELEEKFVPERSTHERAASARPRK